MIATTTTFDDARRAYLSQDFKKAKFLLDEVISLSPSSNEALSARYLRARGYEDGYFEGGKNLDLAYADYAALSVAPVSSSDALIGCARVLFEKDPAANTDVILDLCRQAIDIDENTKAMLLLGLAFERLVHNEGSARTWYMRAHRKGSPWGLTFYAKSHARSGNHVRAFFFRLLAVFTAPILVFKHGDRSPFY